MKKKSSKRASNGVSNLCPLDYDLGQSDVAETTREVAEHLERAAMIAVLAYPIVRGVKRFPAGKGPGFPANEEALCACVWEAHRPCMFLVDNLKGADNVKSTVDWDRGRWPNWTHWMSPSMVADVLVVFKDEMFWHLLSEEGLADRRKHVPADVPQWLLERANFARSFAAILNGQVPDSPSLELAGIGRMAFPSEFVVGT